MATRECPTRELCNERRQFGTVNFVSSSTVVVTFSIAFPSVPKVFLTPYSDVTKRWWVDSITSAGFTVKMTGSDTDTFGWLAIYSL